MTLWLLTGPWQATQGYSLLLSGVWAALLGLLLLICLRRGSMILAMLVFLYSSAYAVSLCKHMDTGVSRMALSVAGTTVTQAAFLILGFLGLTVLLALSVEAAVARHVPQTTTLATSCRSVAASWALWAFFVASLVAAFRAGAWTFYGASTTTPTAGGIRLELQYPSLLFVL
ncbi:MAG: hypothetical protein KKI08_00620, partial [Armatimonadetes bacterium]|nr:hypothetical protein [Armatimonadota bacterium]